jgi:hypothetical protein
MTERVKKLVAGNATLTHLACSHLLGLIEPDDIAGRALYLASDDSRMVTGQVLPVDSGGDDLLSRAGCGRRAASATRCRATTTVTNTLSPTSTARACATIPRGRYSARSDEAPPG